MMQYALYGSVVLVHAVWCFVLFLIISSAVKEVWNYVA